MFAAIYLGVGALFTAFPMIQEILKYVGFAYVLFMAYSIASSTFVHKHEEAKRIGFFRATVFQLVNPKAWIVLMSVAAAYIPFTTNPVDAMIAFSVFLITTYPGAVVWAVFGELLAGFLSKPTPRKIFNISAAVLLVISMLPVLFL